MKTWEKKPPVKGGFCGDGWFSYTQGEASMDTKVQALEAKILKNGKVFYKNNNNEDEWWDYKGLSEFEEIAANDPDNDWRYTFSYPLRSGVYQRQGKEKWVLIERGIGYA